MNKEIIFTGPFKELLPKYIEYKRALGYEYNYNYSKRLRQMDIFFQKNYDLSQIILTKNMVLHYAKRRDNEANSTTCGRCSLIRGFATFLNDLGYTDIYILPNDYIPKNTSNFIPYIFSKEQITTLFNIIDNYVFNVNYLNEYKVFSVLARLLYSCGLRISEALSLKISDLDFTNSIIHIIKSKNNSSRIVCMSNSFSYMLQDYVSKRKLVNSDFLFPSPRGGTYCPSHILVVFKHFFEIANIYTSFGKLPRLHDFRHTFAVHSLQNMVNNGTDIYCSLPFLSSFLGHKNIYATEKYLRLVEDNFSNLLMQDSNLIFPEVNEYVD